METWDAITARRNVRRFTADPLDDADVERILEAGRRAPSSRNSQWWDLILVTDRQRLDRLSRVWRGAVHVAGSKATIAVVAPVGKTDREQAWIHYDLGQMTTQMMIAATDLGIGTGLTAVEDQMLAREVLGLPEDRRCYSLVTMGYPADRPLRPIRRPDRRPFDEVVHRERW